MKKNIVFWIGFTMVTLMLVLLMGVIPALIWLLFVYCIIAIFKKVGGKFLKLFGGK